ncbi:MAG: hypothetical protein QXX12_00420 [Nanopusillaceae archaeon]
MGKIIKACLEVFLIALAFLGGYLYGAVSSSKAEPQICNLKEIYKETDEELICDQFHIRKNKDTLIIKPLLSR